MEELESLPQEWIDKNLIVGTCFPWPFDVWIWYHLLYEFDEEQMMFKNTFGESTNLEDFCSLKLDLLDNWFNDYGTMIEDNKQVCNELRMMHANAILS